MGFFGKLFRRSKNDSTAVETQESTAPIASKTKRMTRREKRLHEKEVTKTTSNGKKKPAVNPEDEIRQTPSFTATTTTSISGRGLSIQTEQKKSVLSPRANNSNNNGFEVMAPQTKLSPGLGPIDLDDTDFDESDNENVDRLRFSDNGLSFQQLQRLNQQASQQHPHHLYAMKESVPLSPQGGHPMDDLAYQSDSDFNLSTDNEDEEYNAMKTSLRVNSQNTSALNTSGLSSQTDDEQTGIFPALQTDDEGTDVGSINASPVVAVSKTSKDRSIKNPSHVTEDDMRAWTLSPSHSSKENGVSPRTGSIHKVPVQEAANRNQVGFADFANFDAVAFADPKALSTAKRAVSSRRVVEGTPDSRGSQSNRNLSASASHGQRDTSLSDLLAQAKRTSSSRRGNSVNSAPAITAQYLREFHGLRSSTQIRSTSGATSVSDIISSLEATNASRLRSSKSRSSHRSLGSRESGTNTSDFSAKERIRERRRVDGTSSSRRHRAQSSNGGDSDHSSENEDFLFDEVAGALGPRGVAADMESLSGRSKSSTGNKSHRSHISSRNSRPRRPKSSNESINSRGSRESRYSHKSTRSYISQMSEQSRSVANDLLRLEMQLAMVGSQEGGTGETSVNGGSIGAASRASRNSRTSRRSVGGGIITMRSKISVVAPPGKLGIILANKADSKGTVVSGVRTSSVLAEKISPGDRIVSIDGEDVSRMTVSEITTIMARKSEFERMLTILTTPKGGSRAGAEDSNYSYRK